MRHLLQVTVSIGERPAHALLIAESGDVALGVVGLRTVVFVSKRKRAIAVRGEVRDGLGLVLIPATAGRILEVLDATTVRPLHPRQLICIGECERIVEVAQPVIAEQPGRAPVVIVVALQEQAHFALAGEIKFWFDLVAAVENDRIALAAVAVLLFVIGRLLLRGFGRNCTAAAAIVHLRLGQVDTTAAAKSKTTYTATSSRAFGGDLNGFESVCRSCQCHRQGKERQKKKTGLQSVPCCNVHHALA